MTPEQTRRFVLALLFPILTLAGCARKDASVKIAVVFPLTGDMGSEGQGLRRSVELAVEQANAAHRFPYVLKVQPFDDRADPKEAVSAANLVSGDPSIVAVIAHYNSGCAIPAAKIYARAPMALITPAATNPEVTAQQTKSDWSGPKVVFRICPTDDIQGNYAASFVYKTLGKRRIALIDDKTAYGQGLADEFQKSFLALGGKIISHDGISVGDKDFNALLTRIGGTRPDGIYFSGLYPEGGLIARQMRELGLKTPFISGDGVGTPGFFDVAGVAADGAYLTISGVPVERLPAAKDFLEAYKKRWTGAGEILRPYDHYGYEAAQILFDALDKAGPDRVKIIDALRQTHHQGVLGLTTFDEKGDSVGRTASMTRAKASDKSFTLLDD